MPPAALAISGSRMGDIFRDTYLGFIRVHVLHHAVKERVFGVAMIAELRGHGYDTGPGTLYPILHGLEKAGYLASAHEVVRGHRRKYYGATPAGVRVLRELQEKIRELTGEVLEDAGRRVAAARRPAGTGDGRPAPGRNRSRPR